MLREIGRVVLVLMTNGVYASNNNLSRRQKKLLAEFGVKRENFKAFANDLNRRRLNPINSQTHKLPENGSSSGRKRGGLPKKKLEDEIFPDVRWKPDRPKGS